MTGTPEETAAREAEEAKAKAAEEAAAAEGGAEEEGEEKSKGKTFAQNEVDKAISKRLAQERKKWDKEQAEAKAKADMSETERLKAEKADAEKAAAESHDKAAQMLITADAKVAAMEAGVKPGRVNKFLRLVDLSGLELDDKGETPGAAIKVAIETELADAPEFKGESTGGASGGDFSEPAGKKKWTQAEVDKLSPGEYEKHREAILAQSRTGTMK